MNPAVVLGGLFAIWACLVCAIIYMLVLVWRERDGSPGGDGGSGYIGGAHGGSFDNGSCGGSDGGSCGGGE